MTLYEKYSEILQSHSTWDYYKNSPNFNTMTEVYKSKTFDYFFENDNAYYFIRKYFETGGKSMALDQITNIYNNKIPNLHEKLKKRFIHTLSAFFLGLSIIDSLWSKGCNFIINNEKYDFVYVWFLTCLFHDVGYVYEYDEQLQDDIIRSIREFDCFEKINELNLGVQNEIRGNSDFQYLISESKSVSFSTPDTKEPTIEKHDFVIKKTALYPDIIVNNYGKYRAVEFGVLDHGIAGGIILYKNLLKMYQMDYKNYLLKEKAQFGPLIPFNNSSDLRVAPAHLALWYYIANCIVAHNIWKCPKNKKAIYNFFGLNNLIDDKFNKLSLGNNPLLFLLSLVDTLEPIKGFEDKFDQLDYLKSIQYCVNGEKKSYCLCFQYPNEKQAKKLQTDLEDWIDLEAKATGKCLEIRFDKLDTIDA